VKVIYIPIMNTMEVVVDQDSKVWRIYKAHEKSCSRVFMMEEWWSVEELVER
jgi:hypothetical protein